MDPQNIPRHIAIIMDGNGRWAKERGLPRIAGHREGAESLRVVLKACNEFGVKYLTVYAFSTENWQRPKDEVDFLMNLFAETIDRELDELMANRIRINFLGRLSKFSPELQKKMKEAMEKTKENDASTLNVMVNYGGRAELADAVQAIINEGRGTVDEESISQHLYTKNIPDPDLLIRTASEMRVSNFLLWQIAYAEIYVTPVLWPDFRREQLKEAIESYQRRVRKFGKTEEQIDAS
ncbi:UDP pyrophosphate synthase [candidate division WOR-1 bacterium DG_54_3]|uniref:Isoprenyl transferase n=1 Tax=candidate division WOR-1 bacterium DG_54_3 TaxID=1703775 RepID=A0A0S7XYU5_UNCSA|nr:MAG: UDP pyrophosphate synthase [candidate division WOR-1 bacterium DG_54_3]